MANSGWAKAKSILTLVKASGSFATLRDMIPEDSNIAADRLQVIEEIGQGAFAFVNLCTLDGPKGRRVAVKNLKPELLQDEEAVRLFLEENKLLRKLRQKYIIEILGMGISMTSNDELKELYLVEEYCSGGSLQDLVFKQMITPTKSVYSLNDALRWCIQVATALAYMHSANPTVIHRDLKLDNILLTSSKDLSIADAKLADFGLAALVRKTQESSRQISMKDILSKPLNTSVIQRLESTSPQMSHNAVVQRAPSTAVRKDADAHDLTGEAGSYGYMSPEVLRSEKYNEKADIFSVMIMVNGGSDDMLIYACNVANGYRPALSSTREGMTEINALIDRCWNGVASLRPDAREIVEELKRIQETGAFAGDGEAMKGDAHQGCSCNLM